MKNFSSTCISPGSESVTKNSTEKHVQCVQHLEPVDYAQRSLLGGAPYLEAVAKDTPIGRGIKKMCVKDKEIIHTQFYSTYYLAKREQPFTDFSDLLVVNKKMKCPSTGKGYRNDNAAALFMESIAKVSQNELSKDLVNANFYLFLSNGSTDMSITEKEISLCSLYSL